MITMQNLLPIQKGENSTSSLIFRLYSPRIKLKPLPEPMDHEQDLEYLDYALSLIDKAFPNENNVFKYLLKSHVDAIHLLHFISLTVNDTNKNTIFRSESLIAANKLFDLIYKNGLLIPSIDGFETECLIYTLQIELNKLLYGAVYTSDTLITPYGYVNVDDTGNIKDFVKVTKETQDLLYRSKQKRFGELSKIHNKCPTNAIREMLNELYQRHSIYTNLLLILLDQQKTLNKSYANDLARSLIILLDHEYIVTDIDAEKIDNLLVSYFGI